MPELKTGERAPAFTLSDQFGRMVSLEGFKGTKLLLFFYSRADTPGCTAQACVVRDAVSVLAASGVRVMGVSPDRPETQQRFDEKFSLGFPLLADEDHAVAECYGVWGEKDKDGQHIQGVRHAAFLLDPDGVILRCWYHILPAETIRLALEFLNAPG